METDVFFSSLIFVFSSLIVFHLGFQIKDEKNISNFDMQGLEI
jgi:hypothetical protein